MKSGSLFDETYENEKMIDWYDRIQSRLKLSYESMSIPTRFGQTHVIAAGDNNGPSIILLQGLGGNSMLWEPQLAHLAKEYRVYAIDVIGQMGKSAKTWLPYSDNSYSEWLLDILDNLKIEHTNIIGISFGARIVMRFSSFAPQRVTRLALLSPIGISMQRLNVVFQLLPFGISFYSPTDHQVKKLVHSLFGIPGQIMNKDCEEAMMIIFSNYRPVSGIRKTIDGMALFFPIVESELCRITAPTLLLVGKYERLCNPQAVIARGKLVFPNLKDAEIVTGAGHVMNYDRPEYINLRLTDFFSCNG